MAEIDKPATSTSDEKPKAGIFERAFDSAVEKIDQEHPWYELPEPLGLTELIGIRNTLRQENLKDTSRSPAIDPAKPPPFEERFESERTPDGSWNDLVHGEMGMAGTRLGRNVPLEDTWPDRPRMLDPSPREISVMNSLFSSSGWAPMTSTRLLEARCPSIRSRATMPPVEGGAICCAAARAGAQISREAATKNRRIRRILQV